MSICIQSFEAPQFWDMALLDFSLGKTMQARAWMTVESLKCTIHPKTGTESVHTTLSAYLGILLCHFVIRGVGMS